MSRTRSRPRRFTNPPVLDMGSGPPVLLLHGQPGGLADWHDVTRRLVGSFRVIVPDRPGYGGTGGERAGVRANAEAAARLLDDRDVSTAVVVGHSWGGAVALLLAEHHPERVKGLVLVSSVTQVLRPSLADRLMALPALGEILALGALQGLGRLLLVPRAREIAAAEFAGVLDERVREVVRGWQQPGVWRTYALEQRALLEEVGLLAAAVGRVDVPTTLVHGTEDRIVALAQARRLAGAIPGAELVELVGRGHLLPLQAPDEVARAVSDTARRALLRATVQL